MKARLSAWLTALTVIAALALPGRAAAQQHWAAPYPYILIDLGTFGGPHSSLDLPATPINAQGIVLGTADTTIADTDYPNFNPYMGQDPYITHAFAWHKGVLTDLGALPGNNSSAIFELSAHGVGAGMSENGTIDPVTGWPAVHAALWQNGRVSNLGTLPGGYESLAIAINDRGQVAGFASNSKPDPFSMGGWGTQARVFLWQDGHMQDLGTLGGPDSFGGLLNERGQITGQSYTSAISNTTTGVPTQDPFLWQDGHMQDLGTLGGTYGVPNWINNRGEVVGQSNLAGDQSFHPFLWDGHTLADLGTLGGSYGAANWINDAGDVAGWASPPGDQTIHALLWRHGVRTDLGTLPGQTCSAANGINAAAQIVGNTWVCGVSGGPPFLWENGVMYALQSLAAPSALRLTEAQFIDDRGEIVGNAVLPNGDVRVFLMVPTGLAASEGITSNAPAPGTTGPATGAPVQRTPCALVLPWRAHVAHAYHRWAC
jgi:probable HAF family extracellular repeat protein